MHIFYIQSRHWDYQPYYLKICIVKTSSFFYFFYNENVKQNWPIMDFYIMYHVHLLDVS